MRIGFDIDGVLADFTTAYRWLLIERTGKNLFPHSNDFESWDWDLECGYTKEERGKVFEEIAQSRAFWFSLRETTDCSTLSMCIKAIEHEHDVYFVTNRSGKTAKRQTEAWLRRHLWYSADVAPTVIISADKGSVAAALKLDAYIDDNYDNLLGVRVNSPATRAYVLDRPYNRQATETLGIVRVATLGQMLDLELPNL